jgi:hypothetical protein
MANIKKLLIIVAFAFAASFSQSTANAPKIDTQVVTTSMVSKNSGPQQLKKQANVRTKNTTWTKIKDLFM